VERATRTWCASRFGCSVATQGVTVARATWRDMLSLWRLERAIFARDAYDPLTLLLLVAWPGNVALKATNGAALVGFVAGDQPWGDQAAWIVTLGVEPLHRRQGVGARLLAECEACLDRPVLRLMVREGNLPAIELYKKFDYTQIRREVGYYGDEAGLLMEKVRGESEARA
jgi:ribosomal protein S18 acetylase RimI-like enzyme